MDGLTYPCTKITRSTKHTTKTTNIHLAVTSAIMRKQKIEILLYQAKEYLDIMYYEKRELNQEDDEMNQKPRNSPCRLNMTKINKSKIV